MAEPTPARGRLESDRAWTLRRIAELEREFTGIVASAAAGSSGDDDEHDPEGATVAYEREHVAALLAGARAHLAAVEAALRSLESGGYGTCAMCGGPIGAGRLAARPAAVTCIGCASAPRR